MQSDNERSGSRLVFNTARRQAFVQSVLAELAGRSDDLLPFGQVREQLNLGEPSHSVGLEQIPLDKIVGSVGRYRDFNRAFLPRAHIDPARWTRIDRLRGQQPQPPVDVFQVGEVYFVRDGNHRVSVARTRGQPTIAARVVQIPIRVPLGSDTTPDDLILKSGYTEFLERTSLDRSCPGQRIELTRPGAYRSLILHVEIHQFYMGLRSSEFPTLDQAAADWYVTVYMPVVERIRDSDILGRFPGRTEADLYLWIAENRTRLQMQYGGQDQASEAVTSFDREHRVPAVVRWARRTLHRLLPRFSQPD